MKKILVIALILLSVGVAYAIPPFPPSIFRDSDCNQAKYQRLGILCQDTDDGKIYKWNGAAMVEIAGTSIGGVPADGDCALYDDGTSSWLAGACPGAGAGAPEAGEYVTYLSNVTLTNERVLTEATGIDLSTAVAGQLRISVNTTEIGTTTFGAGGASYVWTYNVSGTTDPALTVSDGVFNVSAGTIQQGGHPVALGIGSATDNRLVRWDTSSHDGQLLQTSAITVADTTGDMSGVGTISSGAITATGAVIPGTANTYALGSADAEWSNLYLGTGKIYFLADQTVYLTPTTGLLTLTGALTSTGAITASAGIVVADAQTLTFDEAAANPDDADVVFSSADGKLTIAAANGANNENLTLDFDATSNMVTVDSGTGAAITITPALTVTGAITGALTGNASSATYASGATITNATTAATMYPVWVTANTGNLGLNTTSAALSFRPDTGILTATGFAGPINGAVGGTTPAAGAFTTLTAGSASSLILGTTAGAGGAIGSVIFHNATNANHFTITSGTTGAEIGWTLPIAAAGGNDYLVNSSTAGVLSYTNPDTFSVKAGSSSIVTVGALSAGSLASGFTPVTVPLGGTGASTYALNGVLYGNAANAIGVTAIGAEGQLLRVGATPFVPAWTTATWPATVADGSILAANAANTMSAITWHSAGNKVLTNASGVISWEDAAAPGAHAIVGASHTLAAGTAGKILRVSAADAFDWTTSTFADTYDIGTILVASGANTVTGLAAGATTTVLVGGGAAVPVWTTATGTGAPVRAGTPTFTGDIILPSTNADPAATAGALRHDATVAGLLTGALAWYDGDEIRYLVDLDVLPSDDAFVVAYSAADDKFYMKADADTGGATAWNAIGDPSAPGSIDFVTHQQTITSQLNSAGAVLTIADTAADLTADVSFIDFKFTDDGDANGFFMRGYDNAGNDLKWSIGNNGAASFGALTVTSITNDISVVAASTSAQLYGVLSDETGSASGSPLAVFNVNPTLTGVTLSGDITQAAAQDWDIVDNDASALSIDTTGKAGILEIVTLNSNEGIHTSGFLSLGADPADLTTAANILMSNATGILFENSTPGTDINALSVDSGNIVQIAASGSSGVTITPATTFSGAVTIADAQTLTFDEAGANPNDADVRLSAVDGVLTIVGVNGDNNEDLTVNVDAAADVVTFASTTGAAFTFTPDITISGGDIVLISATAGAGITGGDGTITLKGLGSGTDETMSIDLNTSNLITFDSATSATFAFTPAVAFTAAVSVGTNLNPDTDGGASLGTVNTLEWQNLFLNTGAVINFENSDVTITHSSNTLTLAGGDLALGSNNLTMSGYIALGADPAEAGALRMSNNTSIIFEDTEGTGEVNALSVSAAEAILIGSAGADSVTITPPTTYSSYISLTEMAAPGTAAANTARLYAVDAPTGGTPAGFTLLSFVDDTGMVRRLARDNVIIVHNGTVSTITAGKAVYHMGTVEGTGNFPVVGLADADTVASMPAICITAESIAADQYGRCMIAGWLDGVATTGLTAGSPIYVSTTAGTLTVTAPIAPNYMQQVGTSMYANAAGTMQVIIGALQQNETGTRKNDYSVGDGAVGAKTVSFAAAVDGILTWSPTSSTKTITLPNATGTVILSSSTDSVDDTMIAWGSGTNQVGLDDLDGTSTNFHLTMIDDVDASGHPIRLYDTDGVGYVTITGLADGTKTLLSTNATVTVPQGGTGAATFALNGVLYGNTASAIGATAIGAEGQILRVGASPFVPAWTTATYPATTLAGSILVGSNSANIIGQVAAVAAGQPLLSGGLVTIPAYAGYTFAGTGAQTYTFPTTTQYLAPNPLTTIGDLPYANSTATPAAYGRIAAVALGQVLTSKGTGTAPAWDSAPEITSINLGHASDTTIARVSAGVISVEGVNVLSSTATGVQTLLTTPSSANLLAAITDETGTGLAVFNNSPTFVDDITFISGTAGATITGGDGLLTFAGAGSGTDENLTLNLNVDNTATISTSTGVTTIGFSALNLTTSGTLGAGTTTLTGDLILYTVNGDPSAAGALRYDSTVSGMSGGALRWYDNAGVGVRMLVDLDTDPSNDDYVVAYDADADKFYMKVDNSAGSPAWDSIGNPTGNDEIDFGAYTIELNVTDFEIGDGSAANSVIFTGVAGGEFKLGSTGVQFTGDTDGAFTMLGLGNGYDENLVINLDDVENTVGISSGTGVTTVDFGTINVNAAGFTAAASATPTMTFSDSDASAVGTGDIKVDALTGTYDSLLRLYVDDSTGEDTLYVTVDGTNEEILFAKKIDLTSAGIENVGAIADDGAITVISSGSTVTVESVVFTGAAVSSVTTLGMSGDLTMSGNTTNITHSGSTTLAIASTSGTVSVEGVTFTGDAVSGVSTLAMTGAQTGTTAITMGSATVDTGVFTMIKGAQTSDPQATFTLSADGVGGFTIATANGSNGDITLTPSGGETILTTDLTVSGGDIVLGTTSIFSGGDTASLNNIDAIDATTEATIEAALDTLTNVTSVGTLTSLAVTGLTTSGTLSSGAGGFTVDADGDVTGKSYTSTGADGTNRLVITNNTAIAPTGSAMEIYPDANIWKLNQNGTEYIIPIIPTTAAQLTFTTGATTARTITFPDAAISVARSDAGQTFTGVNIFTAPTFTTSITPTVAGSSTIGTTALEWGNLYLTDSAVIYGQADQSNSLTSSASGWTAALSLAIGPATPDDVRPTLTIRGDADSDAGGDTTEALTITLTPNANPTLATWGFTSTQSAGYAFDKMVTFSGGATATTFTGNVSGSAATLTGTLANVASSTSANLATCLSDEQGTGVAIFSDSPTFVDDITVAAAGVKLTGSDGDITLLGLGDGYDENLTINLDDVENTVGVSSSTGVTKVDFGADIAIEAKSFTSKKVSGSSGTNLLYEANSTDTNGVGRKGPASRSSDLYLQYSDSDPGANQFELFPAPTTGTSTAVWTTYGAFGSLNITGTGYIALGADPADAGAIRLANADAIVWEDGTEITLTHVNDVGLATNADFTAATLKATGTSSLTLGSVTGPVAGSAIFYGATSGTITLAPAATAGTTTLTLPATTGTLAKLENKISDLAAVSSAELYGKVSDETGSASGTPLLVFNQGPTLVAPAIGAATATSLLATGIVDGTAPVAIVTTSAGVTLGGTYKSGYTITNPTAAAADFVMTLPTAAAGLQYCVANGATKTGKLTVYTATGTQYIDLDGTLTANTGGIQATAVAGNFSCLIGVDANNWKALPTKGTWSRITR